VSAADTGRFTGNTQRAPDAAEAAPGDVEKECSAKMRHELRRRA